MVEQPQWSRSWLTQSDVHDIEQAITEVETKTNAEIVPMLVRSSSTTGHVPWLLSADFLMVILMADAVFDFRRYTELYSLWLTLAIAVVIAVSFALARLDAFQRFAVTADDRDLQVNQRAELEFYEAGLQKTENRTGILLLVSLMEHRAVVIADKSIAEKVAPETWTKVVDTLVGGAKNNALGKAYRDAIKICGEIVSPHFPITPGNENELHDHLIIKD